MAARASSFVSGASLKLTSLSTSTHTPPEAEHEHGAELRVGGHAHDHLEPRRGHVLDGHALDHGLREPAPGTRP